ncbi:MAG: hypothetical protein P1V35_04950 [Planctomycetota bacterium]|nr:hypothetical protein [Planctomycetota bacterium]
MICVSALLLVAGLVPAPTQDISLEELLRRAKAAQSQAQAPILAEVQAALAQLEAPGLRENSLRSIAHNLLKLGPAAGPLLVPALNPGDTVPAPYQERSDRMLVVLAGFEDLGTTLALLDVLEDGSPAHCRAVLKALRTSPHRAIVADALLPFIADPEQGELTFPALASLSALGGKEAALWLEHCAESKDTSGELLALQALIKAGNPSPAALVLKNLQRKGRSAADQYWVLEHTLRYFGSAPELLAQNDDFRIPLLDLANGIQATSRQGQPTEKLVNGRALALQTMLEIRDLKLGGDFKRQLWAWEKRYPSDNKDILALLAKGGDTKAKREFLEKLNTRVKTLKKAGGRQFANALLVRGTALHRIADHRNAQRDAERGLKVFEDLGDTALPVVKNLRLLAARSAAAGGRFRAAGDFLEKAGLSSKEAAALATDLDFREFMQSRYSEILEP